MTNWLGRHQERRRDPVHGRQPRPRTIPAASSGRSRRARITRVARRSSCVDPRFTRTAAVADLYSPRSARGTDIAGCSAIIRVRDREEALPRVTTSSCTHQRAATCIARSSGSTDGLFTGFDAGKRRVRQERSWAVRSRTRDDASAYKVDPTLQNPAAASSSRSEAARRAATRRRWSSSICGVPAETSSSRSPTSVTSTGQRADRVGTIMYALGWTQHPTGVQIIRAGGDAAAAARQRRATGRRRQHAARPLSNIQGATDMGGNPRDPPRLL